MASITLHMADYNHIKGCESFACTNDSVVVEWRFILWNPAMHVYTLEPPLGESEPMFELYRLLVEMEPIRRKKAFMLVGPYRYPARGTDIIPTAVREKYAELLSVDIYAGKHWMLEERALADLQKYAFVKAKIFTLKLHEPDFPLDFMLRASPDIRKYMKLVRST